MSTAKQQTLSIPTAILGAGVIIGLAIIIAFGGGNSSGTQQATNTGNTNNPTPTAAATPLDVTEAAKKVGVREKAFETCLASDEAAAAVASDMANATASGGRGTPYSVLIGPNGKTLALSGAQPLGGWNTAIDQILDEEYFTPVGDASQNVNPVGADEPVRGNPDAPVTIVEYSDIDCPFCQRVHPTIKEVLATRPDDVNWVYRHFPLEQLHPNAKAKAIAAECVLSLEGEKAYWEYLDLLITG